MPIVTPTQRRYACTLLALSIHSRPTTPGLIIKRNVISLLKKKKKTVTQTCSPDSGSIILRDCAFNLLKWYIAHKMFTYKCQRMA